MANLDETIQKYLITEGAVDYIVYFPANFSNSQIQKEWKKIQDEDRDMYGNDPYSGTSAAMESQLDFSKASTKFDDIADAEKFILDKHDKWNKPLVVKATDKKKKKDFWVVGGWAPS